MISAADQCSFHISRYQRMARVTRDRSIKKKCEDLIEFWSHETAKLKVAARPQLYVIKGARVPQGPYVRWPSLHAV